MLYAGVTTSPDPAHHQVCALEETEVEGGVELHATFYEPGTVDQVAREVVRLDQIVVALDAPAEADERACDRILRETGMVLGPASGPLAAGGQARLSAVGGLLESLTNLGLYEPEADEAGDEREGQVGEEAWQSARLLETRADAVFAALQGYRPSPRGYPLGNQARIQALALAHVIDPEDGLWHRTTDEIDAAAAAYTAFSYAIGHATWLGDPEEGVVVLPVQPHDRYGAEPEPARAPFPE